MEIEIEKKEEQQNAHCDSQHHCCSDDVACTFPEKKKKMSFMKKMIFGSLFIIVIGFSGLSWFVYSRSVDDSNVVKITNVLPFPAYLVGRTTISMKDYRLERDALKKYTDLLKEQQGVSEETDMNKLVETTLLNKRTITTLFQYSGLDLKDDDIEKRLIQAKAETANGDGELFEKTLQDYFGWNISQFKKHMIEFSLKSELLEEKIQKNPSWNHVMESMIKSSLDRVEKGESFENVARELHQKVEISISEDLGVLEEDKIPDLWKGAIQSLENGQRSPVLDLPVGYAVFQMKERKENDGKKSYHLLVMTVPKLSLASLVKNYLSEVRVYKLVKI